MLKVHVTKCNHYFGGMQSLSLGEKNHFSGRKCFVWSLQMFYYYYYYFSFIFYCHSNLRKWYNHSPFFFHLLIIYLTKQMETVRYCFAQILSFLCSCSFQLVTLLLLFFVGVRVFQYATIYHKIAITEWLYLYHCHYCNFF